MCSSRSRCKTGQDGVPADPSVSGQAREEGTQAQVLTRSLEHVGSIADRGVSVTHPDSSQVSAAERHSFWWPGG